MDLIEAIRKHGKDTFKGTIIGALITVLLTWTLNTLSADNNNTEMETIKNEYNELLQENETLKKENTELKLQINGSLEANNESEQQENDESSSKNDTTSVSVNQKKPFNELISIEERENGLRIYDGSDKDNVGNEHSDGLLFFGNFGTAEIEYNLDKNYNKLTGCLSLLEQNKNTTVSMVLTIVGDGEELYVSPTITHNVEPQQISVDISGVDRLILRASMEGQEDKAYFQFVDAIIE